MQNVVIIGSGPAGLTAGIYCGRAKLNPVIITGPEDKINQLYPGGQLVISDSVENFPGFPDPIEGKKLTQELMMKQASRSGAYFLNEEVLKIEMPENSPKIVTTNYRIIKTHSIIIATGASAKWLEIPNEEKYINVGISTCAVCDATDKLNGKHIVVVGGGDSAMEEALYLTKYSNNVTIVHRRNEFRASNVMQDRIMNNSKINIIWSSTIEEYHGEERLKAITIKDKVTSELRRLDLSALFIAIGHIPNTSFLKESGVELDSTGYIITKDNVFTSKEGAFACGDVHDTRYKQAITAAGFGCMSAMEAEKMLELKGIVIKEPEKLLPMGTINRKELQEVNYNQLMNIIENETKPIFLDIVQTVCPLCDSFNPILESFAYKYPNTVFVKVNIDKLNDEDTLDMFEDDVLDSTIFNTPQFFIMKEKTISAKIQPTSTREKDFIEEVIQKFN